MFFKISNENSVPTFPLVNNQNINGFWLNTDKGWNVSDNIVYKGYVLGGSLHEKVQLRNFQRQDGNYIILDLGESPAIHYDTFRSFPLYQNKNTVTNLDPVDKDFKTVHCNSTVSYVNNCWEYTNIKDQFVYNPDQSLYDFDQMVNFVCELLIDSCSKLHIDRPLYVADSNGVDSNLVRSALDYTGKDYTLGNKNDFNQIKLNYWGYKQLADNNISHIQATGFCGDEILLRNPMYCHWQLQPYGIDLTKEFDAVAHSYMKGFFEKNYKSKIAKDTQVFNNKKFAFLHLQNIVSNDFQMWHYNDIISFTPLRSKQLLEAVLYADPDTILRQVIHADVSKECIRKLNSKNLEFISQHKNNVE